MEETKLEPPKTEKATSAKQEISDAPYNGPCKSTRKSTRLMNQAALAYVDSYQEAIEEVVKNSKINTSHVKPCPTRGMRRTRSSRRSEESLSLPSENSEDTSEDKNKNEPVFIILDNAVKDVTDTKKVLPSNPVDSIDNAAESDKTDHKASLRNYRILRSSTSKLELSKDNLTASDHEPLKKSPESSSNIDEKPSAPPPKETIKDAKPDLPVAYRPLPVLKVELTHVVPPGPKEMLKVEKTAEHEEDSNSRSSPAVLIDPVTGFLTPVNESNESYPDATNHSNVDSKISNNHLVSDLSGISTSVLNIKSIAKTPMEPSTTVIQESIKSNQPSTIEPTRAPLVQSPRTRQLPSSTQPPTTPSLPAVADKTPKVCERNIDHPKISSKKAVLTSSPPVTTAFAGSTNTTSSISQPPVVASHDTAAIPVVDLADSKVATTLPPHHYQTLVRAIVTAVVTSTSAEHSSSHPPNVQKSSSAVATPAVSVKSEVNVVYSSNHSLTSHIEHTSNATCKPTSITNVPIPSEHSSASLGKYEVPVTTSLTTSVTWSSTKNSASRVITVPDTHSHVSTIQTNATTHPVLPGKTEARVPKTSHAPKGSSAFTQQAAFPGVGYETSVLSNSHGLAGNNGCVIAELLQNPQLLQQRKEYLAAASSGQLQERSPIVCSNTPVAPGMPPDLAAAARLGDPTPPHTPTPPNTSSNHGLPPSELHSAHGMHLRHSTQPMMVPPSLGLHPSELNAFVHQQIIYAATHPHYAAAMQSDLRAQQEAQARAMGINTRFAYPPIPAVAPNNFRQPPDIKPDAKLIHDLSKIMQEARNAEEKSQQHPIKPSRTKKEEILHAESREEHHISVPSTTAHHAVGLRQQYAHYSNIRQLSPRLVVSPHDRMTDSPVIANLYTAGPARVPQIALPVDDHKPEHHYKTEPPEIKPPVAHQASTYHTIVDGRSSTYKKDCKKRTLGSSISPGPWPPVVLPHVLPIDVHVPPPAHATSQTRPQTHPHRDTLILQRYPLMWQGLLALKNDQAAVQMHFVSGNPSIARASLPPMIDGETAPVRIAQRMRLENAQLDGVAKKMEEMDEHCILMAVPCGKNRNDVLQQTDKLREGFINYLQSKKAAGIVNAAPPGSQQPAYVIHIFPPCGFSDRNLKQIAPDLLHIICDMTHLVIIIATVNVN